MFPKITTKFQGKMCSEDCFAKLHEGYTEIGKILSWQTKNQFTI